MERRSDGVFVYFAVACGLTWALAVPLAMAWMRHVTPAPWAVGCAGLSAFGPLLAALMLAARQKKLGDTFGRWRANPAWLVFALFAPMIVHVIAIAIYRAAFGEPMAWLHPPKTPEQVAALIVFPIGEEFGWRGFAHPRMTQRYGLVRGSLLLGVMWGTWHLAYSVTPDAGRFDLLTFAITMTELPLYSVLIAWVFERNHRSMAIAIAFHAGAHLDHLEIATRDVRLHAVHLIVVGLLAAIVARLFANGRLGACVPTEPSTSSSPF